MANYSVNDVPFWAWAVIGAGSIGTLVCCAYIFAKNRINSSNRWGTFFSCKKSETNNTKPEAKGTMSNLPKIFMQDDGEEKPLSHKVSGAERLYEGADVLLEGTRKISA